MRTTTRCCLIVCSLMVLTGTAAAAAPPGAAHRDGDASAAANLRVTPTVRVFRANRDAVVNINTTQIVRQRFGLFERDPFFRRFFNVQPYERNVKRTALGSGFIVHPEGFIVTNSHVIDGADEVEVTLASGEALPARVLASDPQHDLAVIKVDPPDGAALQAVTLGDSSDLMIGEPAIAIGNPLGYEHTVTSGIVSAVNRELPVARDFALDHLIQTDASINPGNSGGPLLNAYGQVIGVNTAIRGDAQNIGFAIPVSRLRDLVPTLLSPRTLNHADLGGGIVEKRTVTPPASVTVELWWQDAESDEPTRRVTSINGRPCRTIIDAHVELLRVRVGQALVLSDGETEWKVAAKAPPLSDGVRLARATLGAVVRELTDAERRALGLRRSGGIVVTGLERDGPAVQAGIEPGDVIIQIGSFRVGDLDTLASVLSQAEDGTLADVTLIRRGHLGRTRAKLRSPKHGSL